MCTYYIGKCSVLVTNCLKRLRTVCTAVSEFPVQKAVCIVIYCIMVTIMEYHLLQVQAHKQEIGHYVVLFH